MTLEIIFLKLGIELLQCWSRHFKCSVIFSTVHSEHGKIGEAPKRVAKIDFDRSEERFKLWKLLSLEKEGGEKPTICFQIYLYFSFFFCYKLSEQINKVAK